MNSMSKWQDIPAWDRRGASSRERRLERFGKLLELYRAFFEEWPYVIKVTGTNGKGSVSAMLEAMLLADGQRVGLFTSPHLVEPTERIRINGADVTDDELDEIAREIAPFLKSVLAEYGEELRPSFFETLLILALRLFERRATNVAIFEAGIGGAHDVVSLLPGPLSVVTSIAIDHTEQLGPSLTDIAADKAGLATDDSTLVVAASVSPSAVEVIHTSVRERGVTLVRAARDTIESEPRGVRGHRVRVRTSDGTLDFDLPLAGDFQIVNLATAVAVHDCLLTAGIMNDLHCLRGIANTRWAGRLEYFPGEPAWLLDGAHNPEAFHALNRFLDEYFAGETLTLLFGTSSFEKAREALNLLAPRCGHIQLVEGFYKSCPAGELARAVPHAQTDSVATSESPEAAFAHVQQVAGRDATVISAGSIFLAGACRALLLRQGYQPRALGEHDAPEFS